MFSDSCSSVCLTVVYFLVLLCSFLLFMLYFECVTCVLCVLSVHGSMSVLLLSFSVLITVVVVYVSECVFVGCSSLVVSCSPFWLCKLLVVSLIAVLVLV